jgi:hypothetical protein
MQLFGIALRNVEQFFRRYGGLAASAFFLSHEWLLRQHRRGDDREGDQSDEDSAHKAE